MNRGKVLKCLERRKPGPNTVEKYGDIWRMDRFYKQQLQSASSGALLLGNIAYLWWTSNVRNIKKLSEFNFILLLHVISRTFAVVILKGQIFNSYYFHWGCSSAVERSLCMRKVPGSKPGISTNPNAFLSVQCYT